MLLFWHKNRQRMGTESLFLHEPLCQERRDIKFNAIVLTQPRKALNCHRMDRTGLLEAEHMGGRLRTLNPVIAHLSAQEGL